MMTIQHFFDERTATLTYVVDDGVDGVVIDPVRAFDESSNCASWEPCERVGNYIKEKHLRVPYVIDSHAHADHLTGLPYFKERFGACSVTGAGIGVIQETFRDTYKLGDEFFCDGSQFDLLVEDGQSIAVGSLSLRALRTPGHTPAHTSWQIGDAVFLGDTLFMPDYGSARCDFPGGSAATLFESVQRIYAMPDATRLFVCHDYRPGGRPLAFETTVADQKRANVQLSVGTTKEAYVAFREERDAELDAPKLLHPAIRTNICAGVVPEQRGGGGDCIKLDLALGGRV